VSDIDATERIRSAMPMCATLGVTSTRFDAEQVVLSLGWAPELCTSAGLLHGGILMALADAAGGACAFANLPDGAIGTSTIESKTNFMGAVVVGHVIATARPLHVGSTTIVVETELMVDGRLIAKTTQTQLVLRPRPER
jgi:uncharacterized protein (TIGR00369 family)